MTPTADFPASMNSGLPELVSGAIAGDKQAWNGIVRRFSPLVASISRRFRLSESDIDDVRQNVWLSLLQHIEAIREPRALAGWIAVTTRNEALRVVTAHRRIELVDPQTDPRLQFADHTDPATDLLRREKYEAVEDALAEMDPAQQEFMRMFLTDSTVSYRDISRRLNMPTGSIGPTRARYLRKMQETAAVRALAS